MYLRSVAFSAFAAWALFAGRTSADDFAPLFPFVISYGAPDNASNMAHLLDAPAGRHGFVRVEDGRFRSEAGPVRLNATNLTGPANFPTHEDADRLAARLARFGINCVRLHYMDAKYKNFIQTEKPSIVAEDPNTQRNLDPGQLDKLDYLIAALKKRGIYVNVNLHVARAWDQRDGFPVAPGKPGMDKGLDNFEPRMIELQKEYARKLLTRVNPYTGLSCANDPCVAVVEINNENALFRFYFTGAIDRLSDPYAAELRRQWNGWLRKKYASTAAMLEAWKWTPSPLTDEQIAEGRFDRPVAVDGKQWTFSLGKAKATAAADQGVLRIAVTGDGEEKFPKLFRSLVVKKNQAYTLSFKVRRTEGDGEAKLGLAVADATRGWRSLGLHQVIDVGTAWKKCTYSFSAADDSDKAQFQLTRFKVGTYEVDDLSFQTGAKSSFDASCRLEEGTIPVVKTAGYAPQPAIADFYEFLYETEQNYWVGMYRYLKDELKVKSIISGTQLNYSPSQIQARLDYIDSHSYWCHPRDVGPNWRIVNEPMVQSMSCIKGLASQRVLGKPYTVSEYNHPFPNQFGAEGQPMLRAYGRLQGWDGVFEYTYNHEPDFEPNRNTYFFSMIARTDVLAHMPACAAIYLRGDVQEAKTTLVAATDHAAWVDRLVQTKAVAANITAAGFDARQTLLHKTAVDLSGRQGTDPAGVPQIPDDQKVLVSDTGELTWNVEQPGAAYWTVNTPNTKLFTGFPQGRTIDLGGVTLAIGKTRLDWATVSLVSRRATGFGESGRPANILLAATALAENKGMTFQPASKGTVALSDWGKGPVCVEGVPATITLPASPARVQCFALDPSGDRKKPVAVEKSGSGAKIVLKPDYETVWYEIDVR